MISVITLSTRPERLKITEKCLRQQTYRDVEWIICVPAEKLEQVRVENATVTFDPPKEPNDVWTYNKALNKAVELASGKQLVFYQDSIWIPPDALEKLLYWHEKKDMCVTGVGDIYEKQDKWGVPIVKCWSDPRKKDEKNSYECMPEDWEMNFALCSRKAFEDIGGADELLDTAFGMDNISICERLDALGYRFWLDQSLEIKGLNHGRHQDWDKNHAMNGQYYKIKDKWIQSKVWPRLPFL